MSILLVVMSYGSTYILFASNTHIPAIELVELPFISLLIIFFCVYTTTIQYR